MSPSVLSAASVGAVEVVASVLGGSDASHATATVATAPVLVVKLN